MTAKATANIGFVGCGTHSTNNLYPMLKYSRCRLQAVCDLRRDLAEFNARVFGGKAVYTSVDEMLEREALDGVMVGGPPSMHYEVGLKVLRRGIPLFVEKPPAETLAQAEEMVRAARQHGTFVMTGFMKRWGLAYRKVRQLAEQGQFVPACGTFRYLHWPMRDLKWILLGMSIHPIDLAISYFGDVAAVTSVTHESEKAISLGLTLQFRSGCWAHLNLGSPCPRIQERVELTGMLDGKPALIVVDNIQSLEIHTMGDGGCDLNEDLSKISPELVVDDIRLWRPDYALPNMKQNSPFFQGYALLVREFGDAILEKREPYPSTEDALKAMRVINAVIQQPNGTTEIRG